MLLQQAVVEFIGPFALVFLGAGSIIMTGGQDLVAIALAHGLAIGVMVAAAGHISGGSYNPALTVGLAIAGKLTPPQAAIYIVAELLGAVAAALSLIAIFPETPVEAVRLGTPQVAAGFEASAAMFAEVIMTFFLMFVVFGSAVDRRGSKAIAPLAIGLTISAGVFAMGNITGAALNPSRHFGPALVEGLWDDFWVWWIGPILGAAIAAVLYKWVLMDDDAPASAAADDDVTPPAERTQTQMRRRRTSRRR